MGIGKNHKKDCNCMVCRGESIFIKGHKLRVGIKHSDKTKEKMRQKALEREDNTFWKGKRLPEYIKKKISKAKEGHPVSKKTRRKLRLINLGKRLSEETKRKISKNNRKYWEGKKRNIETREKISKSSKGKVLSEEDKKNKRIAAIKYIEKYKLNGSPLFPRIGKNEKQILDEVEKIFGYKILRQYPLKEIINELKCSFNKIKDQ